MRRVALDAGICPCCCRRFDEGGGRREHHDHFASELRKLWVDACLALHVPPRCAFEHDEDVVSNFRSSSRKPAAAYVFRNLMRFNVTIFICFDCNELDAHMKKNQRGGSPRLAIMAERRNFSATCAEITRCVIGPDGVHRGRRSAEAVAEYERIVMSDPWDARVARASLWIEPFAASFQADGPCRICPVRSRWSARPRK